MNTEKLIERALTVDAARPAARERADAAAWRAQAVEMVTLHGEAEYASDQRLTDVENETYDLAIRLFRRAAEDADRRADLIESRGSAL